MRSRLDALVMHMLDLTRYRQPPTHFVEDVPAGRRRAPKATRTGSWRRSTLDVRHPQGQGPVPARRHGVRPSSSWRAAAASSRSGCRSTRRSTCGTCRRRRTSAEAEREVEEDDLATSYYRDDQIDLNELMREQFYLALPMKPLCQDDCQGLCPQCGTNLNTERLRLPAAVGRSAAGGAEGARATARLVTTMPNPKRRHSKTRTAKRRTHDALRRADDRALPAVPRAEGAAPRLPALRLLPRSARCAPVDEDVGHVRHRSHIS